MAASLKAVEGRLVVEIADAKGEVLDYDVEPIAPSGWTAWGVGLTRRDTGASYTIRCTSTGFWECDCPSFRFRCRKAGLPCKHIGHAKELRPVLESMAGLAPVANAGGTR